MNTNDTKTTGTASHGLEVTDASFQAQVLDAKEPVLVDFWAAWCGPCRMLAPVVEQLAGDYAGRARVLKLDVDANPEMAARYQITSIPTLLVFKNGEVVAHVVGAASKKVLASKLDAQLN